MTRTRTSDCAWCRQPLGEAMIAVNAADSSEPQGKFHPDCWAKACEAVEVRRRHQDLETVLGREGEERAAPAFDPQHASEQVR